MALSELHKLILNIFTLVAWLVGIAIMMVLVARRKSLKAEMGVSYKTYLALVGLTEIFYVIGAIMILSAMGINVMQHLARLEFWKFYQIIRKFDVATIQVIGAVGWVGFLINTFVAFLSPGYLLIRGGKRLPKYFYYSAWTEITIETCVTVLIFSSLMVK